MPAEGPAEHPVPAETPVAEAAVEGENENPEPEASNGLTGNNRHDWCVICQDNISSGHEHLPCTHVFHRDCLWRWRETAQITDPAKCPYRCHLAAPIETGALFDAPVDGEDDEFQII